MDFGGYEEFAQAFLSMRGTSAPTRPLTPPETGSADQLEAPPAWGWGKPTPSTRSTLRALLASISEALADETDEQARQHALAVRHAASAALSALDTAPIHLGQHHYPTSLLRHPQAFTPPALLDRDALIGAPRPGPDTGFSPVAA